MPILTPGASDPILGVFEEPIIVLTAATKADPYTEEQITDWSQAPTEHPELAEIQPLSSTEATLTAGTVVSRWRCYLDTDTTVTPGKRIRWEGDDFEVDGKVEAWKVGGFVDHYECTLKLVEEG